MSSLNNDKLNKVLRKFQEFRQSRPHPILDALASLNFNGSSAPAKQDTQVIAALEELKSRLEESQKENEDLRERLRRKDEESFRARVG